MQGVMIVVVPLRAILAAGRIVRGIEQARLVVVVLQHEMDVPAAFAREVADGLAELVQQMRLAAARRWHARRRAAARRSESRSSQCSAFSIAKRRTSGTSIVDRVAPRRLRLA